MSEVVPKDLEECRKEIDAIDVEFINLLARRFEVVHKIGELKIRENMAVVQPQRAARVIERSGERAAEKGLDPEFVMQLYRTMIDHAHVLEHQQVEDAKGKAE